MMKKSRSLLLAGSTLLVALLLGGGFVLRAGATENSYRQAVRFAEILSLVLENYVDPVEAEGLLRGAYEGMLAGLDPNGAFLTPEEVVEWKRGSAQRNAGPGIDVLKLGRTVQVVAVAPGSSAAKAGVVVGDHIRSVDGRPVRDLSLEQTRRLIQGSAGSEVRVEMLRPHDGFRREEVELTRQAPQGRSFELRVEQGTAVLALHDLQRLDPSEMFEELDDVRSRGVDRLLLDLRNLAQSDPRQIAKVAALFADGTLLRLRDRSGRLIEAVESGGGRTWTGSMAVLINGASAGAAEALAALAKEVGAHPVFGEASYGLGAEAKLYELEAGYGMLVSAELWETASGESWNIDGVEPDTVVRGEGRDYAEGRRSQLDQVLELLAAEPDAEEEEEAPAEAA